MTIGTQPSLLHALWRYKLHIIGAAVVAGLVAFGISMIQPTLYQSEGTVFLNDPRNSGSLASTVGFVPDLDRHINSQAELMQSFPVVQRAAEILADGTTADEIHDAVSATPAVDVSAVAVRSTMPTANESVATKNAVVHAYQEIVTTQVRDAANDAIAVLEESAAEAEIRIAELDVLLASNPTDSVLEGRRSAAMGQLVDLDTRAQQLATGAALYGSGVRLYVESTAPTAPIQPRPLRNLAVAIVLGALGAGVWAWWADSAE